MGCVGNHVWAFASVVGATAHVSEHCTSSCARNEAYHCARCAGHRTHEPSEERCPHTLLLSECLQLLIGRVGTTNQGACDCPAERLAIVLCLRSGFAGLAHARLLYATASRTKWLVAIAIGIMNEFAHILHFGCDLFEAEAEADGVIYARDAFHAPLPHPFCRARGGYGHAQPG